MLGVLAALGVLLPHASRLPAGRPGGRAPGVGGQACGRLAKLCTVPQGRVQQRVHAGAAAGM